MAPGCRSLILTWLLQLGRQGWASVAWSWCSGKGRAARSPGSCGTATGAPAGRVDAQTGEALRQPTAGTRREDALAPAYES